MILILKLWRWMKVNKNSYILYLNVILLLIFKSISKRAWVQIWIKWELTYLKNQRLDDNLKADQGIQFWKNKIKFKNWINSLLILKRTRTHDALKKYENWPTRVITSTPKRSL
jgi:hypothetical protein